ncbi:MAG: helix-turn-helix transcriptional regulator [Clostridiales bacterium]|nr:helix-turn-helix transcriptional regulator [Clostridiales bacterium]
MDQQKIGAYLRELRKAKGITQEQLADKFYVTRRTVSRWETGSNMPEIEIMIELADYYEVDLRDLLRGERKEDIMNTEIKETAMAVAEYSSEDKKKVTRRFNYIFIAATVCLIGFLITLFAMPDGYSSPILDFIQGVTLGVSLGALILGILLTSGVMEKFAAAKRALMKK